MTEKTNLPGTWSATENAGTPSETAHVVPGSWWRLTGEFGTLHERKAPEHGLVFLMSDVRIIDGEIHTVILHEHPRFGKGTFKVLLGDLLTEFSLEPRGEQFRETELEELMGEINAITQEMSQPPSDDTFLAQLPAPEKAPAPSASDARAVVPKVLLPSGDVDAAQKKIETALAVVEARRAWVEARTEKMQQRMGIVAQYQTEKVAIGLAGIAEQRKWAETMLENVQTMRLWLGDDQFFQTLVDGKGADRSEPLHFMQRMLYLDEEIYTHRSLIGLTGDDLNELPRILSNNPDLVERMLPHPRSVVIAKARRNTRPLSTPGGVIDVMAMFDAIESDSQVQILIRNGEQVHLVATDEITSKAKRLFPSRAEIDAIFTEKSFRSEARMITPHDIEYSDKRADHDSRALFYKRVLLILWGLSEREGILGDFIGEGVNWLEETVHSDSFRFIHDEENVLADDRPSVRLFLSRNRKAVRAGSRIMALWEHLVTEDTAPQIFERNSTSDRGYRKVDLVEEYDVRIVETRDRDLVVKCPVRAHSYSTDRSRSYNTPVRISWPRRSWGKMEMEVADGMICLDGLRSEDLAYYFESRIHREFYLTYLHLFERAMTVLVEEEKVCDPIVGTLQDEGYDLNTARNAVTLLRGARKWALPDPGKDLEKLKDLCEIIAKGVDLSMDAPLFVEITASGALEIGRREDVEVFGKSLPFARVDIYRHTKTKGWVRKSDRLERIDTCASPGKLRIADNISADLISEISMLPSVLMDLEAVQAIATSPEDQDGLQLILDIIKGDGVDAEDVLNHCKAWAHAQTGQTVSLPYYSTVVGYVIDESEKAAEIYALELYVDPVLQCLALGHQDSVRTMTRGLYRRPDTGFSNLSAHLERIQDKGDTPYGIRATRVTSPSDVSKDPARGVCHAGPAHTGHVRVSQEREEEGKICTGSLREAFVDRTAYYMFKPNPKTEAEKVERMAKLSFAFFEGCEEIIERVSGFHARPVSLNEGDQDHGVDP